MFLDIYNANYLFCFKEKRKKENFRWIFRVEEMNYIWDILKFSMNFVNEDWLNDYLVIKIVQIQTSTSNEKSESIFDEEKKKKPKRNTSKDIPLFVVDDNNSLITLSYLVDEHLSKRSSFLFV